MVQHGAVNLATGVQSSHPPPVFTTLTANIFKQLEEPCVAGSSPASPTIGRVAQVVEQRLLNNVSCILFKTPTAIYSRDSLMARALSDLGSTPSLGLWVLASCYVPLAQKVEQQTFNLRVWSSTLQGYTKNLSGQLRRSERGSEKPEDVGPTPTPDTTLCRRSTIGQCRRSIIARYRFEP